MRQGIVMKISQTLFCTLVAASLPIFAASPYEAYRLGQYNQSMLPLAAESGRDAVADYYLGRMYLYGYGQLKNQDLAIRYFTKSANKGFLPARLLLAKYELQQQKNPAKAFVWFKQAADQGDLDAMMYVAAAYINGYGVSKNPGLAKKYYIDAAKRGNTIAQCFLAEEFLDTRHMSNKKLGAIWLMKAANAGNPRAQMLLAGLKAKGQLVAKDPAAAKALLEQAISQNYTPALMAMGELMLQEQDVKGAVEWLQKAEQAGYVPAQLALAKIYLDDKSPVVDKAQGFMLTLKAAQAGDEPAQKLLTELYKKGIGVTASDQLAEEWAKKAEQTAKAKTDPVKGMAQWLTNGRQDDLQISTYNSGGIFSAWTNANALRDNIYNLPPKMKVLKGKALFKPDYHLVNPNQVPLNAYYDALVQGLSEFAANQWTFPMYRLNPQVEALEQSYSKVLSHHDFNLPYQDIYFIAEADDKPYDPLERWTGDWLQQANYLAVFNSIYFRAMHGDAEAQFDLAQMFQYGIGVQKSTLQAIYYYEKAAEQQHVGAEYSLGIIYLTDDHDPKNFQRGLDWLTDAAFKGNSYAQYVLGNMMMYGLNEFTHHAEFKTDPEQGQAMLYLSAANGYGPAEYQLADSLARQNQKTFSLTLRQKQDTLIRDLYAGAATKGVAQAYLPLAYYNAMSSDSDLQKSAFKSAKQQARDGNAKAALLLGMLYDRGIGVKENPTKATYWYQQAGDNQVSQFILGTYFAEGKRLSQDMDKARELLKQSAQADFSYADLNLAVLEQQAGAEFIPLLVKAYELGNSAAGIVLADTYLAKQDSEAGLREAQGIYQQLAEKGDAQAQLKLAFMLDKGLGFPRDETKALYWYTQAAEQGNPLAQYQLAQLYQLGINGLPDYAQAMHWYQQAMGQLPQAANALGFLYETVQDNYAAAREAYEKAAAMGDPLAKYNLGLMYEYGKGVPVDFAKAKEFYVQASDKNQPAAMSQLAGLYFYGLGMPRDDQQALHWYKKAADLGNPNALYQLGLLAETGVAMKLDYPQSLKYYQQAADQGNEKAMLALARMYFYGIGVEKDQQAAFKLYEQLAARNNAYAQYKMATYYLEGLTGERQPDKGRRYLEQASENGSEQARKALQFLDAQQKKQVSYLEPLGLHPARLQDNMPADQLYFTALSEWNRGDELLSRSILRQLVKQYPHYAPAKRTYEQLNQAMIPTVFG